MSGVRDGWLRPCFPENFYGCSSGPGGLGILRAQGWSSGSDEPKSPAFHGCRFALHGSLKTRPVGARAVWLAQVCAGLSVLVVSVFGCNISRAWIMLDLGAAVPYVGPGQPKSHSLTPSLWMGCGTFLGALGMWTCLAGLAP